jgi:hypothetical protein
MRKQNTRNETIPSIVTAIVLQSEGFQLIFIFLFRALISVWRQLFPLCVGRIRISVLIAYAHRPIPCIGLLHSILASRAKMTPLLQSQDHAFNCAAIKKRDFGHSVGGSVSVIGNSFISHILLAHTDLVFCLRTLVFNALVFNTLV